MSVVPETGCVVGISRDELLAEVDDLHQMGRRLVQILAVDTGEAFELTYSFGLGMDLVHLRFSVRKADAVPSVTRVYPGAFLYENEIRELYGVQIERVDPDYRAELYGLGRPEPFRKPDLEARVSEGPISFSAIAPEKKEEGR